MENGKGNPSPATARALDNALQTGGELPRLVIEVDAALLHRAEVGSDDEKGADSVRRREVLGGLAALAGGATISGVSLELLRHSLTRTADSDRRDWHDIAVDYAHDFYSQPPAALLDQLSVDLTVLQDLMATAADVELRRAAGQLSVIMAMTLASTGQPTLARRWWRTARYQADASGDLDVRVWVRDWEVVNGTYENRSLDQILALADETIELLGNRVCRGAAGVYSGRAQALALAGRSDEAVKALHKVSDLTERMPSSITADADSMFGWPEVRLHHTASYVHTHIGDTRRAAAAQERALELYPAHLARERAQLQMHRACCLIQEGHVTDGLRYAADTLDELPRERHNALLYEVVSHVVSAVPQNERRRAELRDLRDRIAVTSTAAA
jgi:tetratricopeptide (TPR) repeat protein